MSLVVAGDEDHLSDLARVTAAPVIVHAEVEGRGVALSPVDRPKLSQGAWVRPGGVVVEAAFASAVGIHVGDRLTLGGSSFEVVGTAVTAAIPDYPDACTHLGCFLAGAVSKYNPGLVWATEADARYIARAASSTPLTYFLNLKLRDPGAASAFAASCNSRKVRTASSAPRSLRKTSARSSPCVAARCSRTATSEAKSIWKPNWR